MVAWFQQQLQIVWPKNPRKNDQRSHQNELGIAEIFAAESSMASRPDVPLEAQSELAGSYLFLQPLTFMYSLLENVVLEVEQPPKTETKHRASFNHWTIYRSLFSALPFPTDIWNVLNLALSLTFLPTGPLNVEAKIGTSLLGNLHKQFSYSTGKAYTQRYLVDEDRHFLNKVHKHSILVCKAFANTKSFIQFLWVSKKQSWLWHALRWSGLNLVKKDFEHNHVFCSFIESGESKLVYLFLQKCWATKEKQWRVSSSSHLRQTKPPPRPVSDPVNVLGNWWY